MREHIRAPLPQIEVIAAASSQEPILANLLELYAHDFSEFHDVELGADGRFGYRHLPLYWSEKDRKPFLVWVDGKEAGFALVKRASEVSGDADIWDVAEFFVLREHRRRGVGVAAAHEVWRRLPGRWEVRVMESNQGACRFWERAVAKFAGCDIDATRFEKNGARWRVFSFQSAE
jgi:predicted acetyltransferase